MSATLLMRASSACPPTHMSSRTAPAARVDATVQLAYFNAGGLSRHPPSQFASALLCSTGHADVIAIGETWLLRADLCALSLPGYAPYHCVRPQGGRGRPEGGVSVFVHERLQSLRPSVRMDPEAGIVCVARMLHASHSTPSNAIWCLFPWFGQYLLSSC